jgi:hypothetical protein
MKREPFHDRPLIRRPWNSAAGAAGFFFILALASTARAQLRWEERSLEFHPTLADTQVVAEFHFTNAGNKPVTIKNLATSCGCTTATMEKNHVYAPGGKGTITAVYDIGGRNGLQKASVYVYTSDGAEPDATLQLTIAIPKLLEIDTVFLNWQPGEALKPKTVNIKVLGDYPVHSLAVSRPDWSVKAQIKPLGNRNYQLVITPKFSDPDFVIIDIKPDYPKDPPKLYHVYVSVGR